ncbi:MAG: hypothetical protein V3V52_06995 [Candidatus Adiutricales bacterium]
MSQKIADRSSEWFVPRFGPVKLRIFIGLLFLPYTGMVLSFTVMGAMLAETIFWDRVAATVIVYFLGLGISAHALDALGGKETGPWGRTFTKFQLWSLAIMALVLAYALAVYYMIRFVPWVWPVAIVQGFFVFAYNLEWFGGKFHKDNWFAFSWGFLPVISGFMVQTNRLNIEAVVIGLAMAFFSLVEIKASRPYKELKKQSGVLPVEDINLINRYETMLKCLSFGVILLGLGLLIRRVLN